MEPAQVKKVEHRPGIQQTLATPSPNHSLPVQSLAIRIIRVPVHVLTQDRLSHP